MSFSNKIQNITSFTCHKRNEISNATIKIKRHRISLLSTKSPKAAADPHVITGCEAATSTPSAMKNQTSKPKFYKIHKFETEEPSPLKKSQTFDLSKEKILISIVLRL